MKSRMFILLIVLCSYSIDGRSQGTLQFDQQSTTGAIWEGVYNIQSSQPFGQSFTPSLNAVGFVQLFLVGVNSGDNANATVSVDLLSGSITGPVLAQSLAVTVPIGVESSFTFQFSTPVSVTPGTTYYLQPVITAGAADASVSPFYHYSGGTSFRNGTADPSQNLYFREGVLGVPEPSTWALLVAGGAALLLRRRRIK